MDNVFTIKVGQMVLWNNGRNAASVNEIVCGVFYSCRSPIHMTGFRTVKNLKRFKVTTNLIWLDILWVHHLAGSVGFAHWLDIPKLTILVTDGFSMPKTVPGVKPAMRHTVPEPLFIWSQNSEDRRTPFCTFTITVTHFDIPWISRRPTEDSFRFTA